MRREFVQTLGVAGAAALTGQALQAVTPPASASPFTISLSLWAFHRAIFGPARDDYQQFIATLLSSPDDVLQSDMDPRDIVWRAREMDVNVVDLVNILWFGHGQDRPWLNDFKSKAKDANVTFGVLMCDQLGQIAAAAATERQQSVEGHTRWMETAAALGCPFLRVNPYGQGSYLEQCQRGAETLHTLAERSADYWIGNPGRKPRPPRQQRRVVGDADRVSRPPSFRNLHGLR